MADLSLMDKFKIIIGLIGSSPLFLVCFLVAIISLIYYIICILKSKKINKLFFLTVVVALLLVLIINYNKIVLELIDNLFNNLFMALYFPNLSIYIIILLISNFFFMYGVFNKKIKKSYRIIDVSNALIIDTLLFFIMDIVSKNKINIYENLTVYSNSNLLVLLELTTGVFTSWLLLNLLITSYHKLERFNEIRQPKIPEIIFDDD